VTSHKFIVTVSLSALRVFITVLVYGFLEERADFFKRFVRAGSIYILPAGPCSEVLAFLSGPVSHSGRLFANCLAATSRQGVPGCSSPCHARNEASALSVGVGALLCRAD